MRGGEDQLRPFRVVVQEPTSFPGHPTFPLQCVCPKSAIGSPNVAVALPLRRQPFATDSTSSALLLCGFVVVIQRRIPGTSSCEVDRQLVVLLFAGVVLDISIGQGSFRRPGGDVEVLWEELFRGLTDFVYFFFRKLRNKFFFF